MFCYYGLAALGFCVFNGKFKFGMILSLGFLVVFSVFKVIVQDALQNDNYYYKDKNYDYDRVEHRSYSGYVVDLVVLTQLVASSLIVL